MSLLAIRGGAAPTGSRNPNHVVETIIEMALAEPRSTIGRNPLELQLPDFGNDAVRVKDSQIGPANISIAGIDNGVTPAACRRSTKEREPLGADRPIKRVAISLIG